MLDEETTELDPSTDSGVNGAVATAPAQEEPEYVETTDEAALRSLIFQTSDVVERLLDIPEWKINGKMVQVLIRALNAGERAEYITTMQKSNGDLSKAYPDLVILACRHPKTKNKIFKPADRGELQKKLGNAIERIAMNVVEISGLDEKSLKGYLKN